MKIFIVLPAYNAEKTLALTLSEIPDISDLEIVVVDDFSTDETYALAINLGVKHVLRHTINRGYGGNQKTCYNYALSQGADIVVMLHPDYQYTPKLIPSMVHMIKSGLYPVVFGSRILGKGALAGGMPLYKYIANRVLTLFQNILCNQKLTEYHTGYRAYSAEVLRAINYNENSDDFIFDNQVIVQIFSKGFQVGEVSCPTKYFPEASSINFRRSVRYGMGVVKVSIQYFLFRIGLFTPNFLK